MIEQNLNENWSMRIVGEEKFYPAQVPGSVVADLVREGVLPEPYYRDNEIRVLDCMKHDFEYRCFFDVSKELFAADELLLQFDGLDTVADISFNGKKLASVKNMHRTFVFPVTGLCKEKENRLVIYFYSPTNYIADSYRNDPVDGCEECMQGFVHLRKAHYMFGWDWGPRLADAGIWRPVKLLGVSGARISQVKIHQEHEKTETGTRVTVSVQTEVLPVGADAAESFSVRTTLYAPDGTELGQQVRSGESLGQKPVCGENFGQKLEQEPVCGENFGQKPVCGDVSAEATVAAYGGEIATEALFVVENARLWWQNGGGEQPLYTVKAELFSKDGVLLDTVTKRIGLRTMTMNTEKDAYGSRFAHMVNGVEVFAMGADYIPEDSVLSRMNPERTYALLKQCKDANFNCIRVWGGGFYPGDDFYDACDELGLIVWQDFMFACGHYRLTEEFKENIRAELVDNIRRLRHHASLGLFCGNNEMELFTKSRNWNGTDELAADYLEMYETLFPKLMEEEAPDVFYWPASPSSGGSFDEPNDENRGDVHYWEVWHGNRPFTEYRTFFFRYLSEFGFQSFPSEKTIETFTEPQERNIFSYVMEKHQRNAAANGKILGYLAQMYLYPTSFSGLVYASQLLQAEAIRYGVEHFRRNRGRCMGTVYWQLNDCWPVASWASIDYYGRWKALHYFAKRFFAPLLLSAEECGLLGQCPNVNEEKLIGEGGYEKSVRFCVTNDSPVEQAVNVLWEIRDASGEILEENLEKMTVPAHTAQFLEKRMLPGLSVYTQYISYRLEVAATGKAVSAATGEAGLVETGKMVSEATGEAGTGEIVSAGSVLFCPPKHFQFQNPKLSVYANGDELVVSADCFAKSVYLKNANDDLLLSDNFFDMDGGEKRVRVLSGGLDGLEAVSVYDIR